MDPGEVADELQRLVDILRRPDKPGATQAEVACGMYAFACRLREMAWQVETAMLEITDNL